MTHFRCYYLTSDNRLDGVPVEFSAASRDDAVRLAAGFYVQRRVDLQHGVEIWAGTSRVFFGDPTSVARARAAA